MIAELMRCPHRWSDRYSFSHRYCRWPTQVSEWLSLRHSELLPLTEEAVLRVDARLASRTFLVGGALSLADLALFDVVHRPMVRP